MSVFHQIASQPRYYLITVAGIGVGAGLGWIIHWLFPVVPAVPAIYCGAVACGAGASFIALAQGVIAIARELEARIKHDMEIDMPNSQPPAPNHPKNQSGPPIDP